MNILPQLDQANRILIAGAGGGFDFFHALPLYLKLREAGKEVILGNFAFTSLKGTKSQPIGECGWQITDESLDIGYFPEKYLYDWLKNRGIDQTVIGFENIGPAPLRRLYEHIIDEYKIDTVILIDGGTDSLMWGNEYGLGTPVEDATSIAAAYKLPVERKYLISIGFGIDHYHGVCHSQFLENIAGLTKEGGYLGCFAFNPADDAIKAYIDLVSYANEHSQGAETIVGNSIKDAFVGEFGNFHSTQRTRGSKLYINPLMGIYWAFELEAIAKRNLYLKMIEDLEDRHDVQSRILQFRGLIKAKEWESIPH